VLLGKWPGLAALLAGYTGVVCAGEFASPTVCPVSSRSPVAAGVFPFAKGALLLTLARPGRSFWHGIGNQVR